MYTRMHSFLQQPSGEVHSGHHIKFDSREVLKYSKNVIKCRDRLLVLKKKCYKVCPVE